MTSFKMALDSILEKKVRSFLTMLGIIIGVVSVLVLVALVEGYNLDITAYYEKMGVNKVEVKLDVLDSLRAKDYTKELVEFKNKELKDIASGATPIINTGGIAIYGNKKTEDTNLIFGNEEYSICGNYLINKGRDIVSFDCDNRSDICVLGSFVADSLFEYVDPIGEAILIGGRRYEVVGVYYQKDGGVTSSLDDIVVVPYTLSKEVLTKAYPKDYIVKVNKSTDMDYAMKKVEEFFGNLVSQSIATYETKNGNTEMSESKDEMTSISVVLGGIAGIALLVGGIGIMNIMLVTVSERTREIGIKKAIGAPNSDIINQFLIEAALLSAMGGILGIVLGYFMSAVLGKIMYDAIIFPSTIVTLGAFMFSVIIGIIFGSYPAIQAAKLQVVDALRVD